MSWGAARLDLELPSPSCPSSNACCIATLPDGANCRETTTWPWYDKARWCSRSSVCKTKNKGNCLCCRNCRNSQTCRFGWKNLLKCIFSYFKPKERRLCGHCDCWLGLLELQHLLSAKLCLVPGKAGIKLLLLWLGKSCLSKSRKRSFASKSHEANLIGGSS